MLSSRWRKVLRDLWQNKGRSLLVVLSITVGVFAVGTVVHMQALVQSDMIGSYEAANPASAVIYSTDSFDEDLLETIRAMPEVAVAEGRRTALLRFQTKGEDAWYPLRVVARDDYEDMQVNILQPEPAFGPDPEPWPGPVPLPPPEHELMLERISVLTPNLGLSGKVRQGDTLLVETPMGKQREMRIAGLVGDFTEVPATFYNQAYGFVTMDTMDWLSLPRDYNELVLLVAGDRQDEAYITRVADAVVDRLERGGVTVARKLVPTPGELPLDMVIDGLIFLLGALGLLSLLSSAFLLINTIQALLAQQVQQIGVMKAVGARGRQIMAMYLGLVLIYGLLAVAIAVPLGTWAAREVINVMAYLINFRLSGFYVPPQVVAIEVAMGLLVPFLAALWPIVAGTRITVREAIADYGLSEEGLGSGLVDRLIEQVRGLPRPLLLSLRNTFRRKGRLALTLLTLTLAGTIFISVISVYASMNLTVEDLFQDYRWNAILELQRPYRIDRLESATMRVPGVSAVESWIGTSTYRLRPDDSEGVGFALTGMPANSAMFQPGVIEGRWLRPEDENAIVVNTYLVEEEPDIEVGDEVVLDIRDRETTWNVVGVIRSGMPGPAAYANYRYLARVVRDVGRASTLYVITEQEDTPFQEQVVQDLKDRFDREGLNWTYVFTISRYRANIANYFSILIAFLMSMAILLAVVGGVGLAGTMLLNVLERVREVGVMRAIGASNDAVVQIFVAEGVVIGLISWALGVILAMPLGKLISDVAGQQFMGIALSYTYSPAGIVIWLVLAILVSIVASVMPAQNAARLTVREVLSYL